MLDDTWYLYPYYDEKNPELHNWNRHMEPSVKEQPYHIMQHAAMTKLTIGMYMSLRKGLFQSLR